MFVNEDFIIKFVNFKIITGSLDDQQQHELYHISSDQVLNEKQTDISWTSNFRVTCSELTVWEYSVRWKLNKKKLQMSFLLNLVFSHTAVGEMPGFWLFQLHVALQQKGFQANKIVFPSFSLSMPTKLERQYLSGLLSSHKWNLLTQWRFFSIQYNVI